ncbi:MAG: putative CRISPR-associated protein [Myxococcales bacterium]|nr:putative CRISPR-associated protein [Myxococcales bacterium]
MTRRLLLLSTCGTSLLTNRVDDEARRWLTNIANEATLDAEDAARLEAHTRERAAALAKAPAEERRALSAELNGIAAALERWPSRRVQHVLVHTDTAVGRAAYEAVRHGLESDGAQVMPLTAPGLRTDDVGSYRAALSELTRLVETLVPGYAERGWTVVFNLTGGFKSINAYLQALGMFYADSCVFLFEGAPDLMEIPRLPVELLDKGAVGDNLTLFRRLAAGYAVTPQEAAGVPDSLLLIVDKEVTTSVWGDAVWGRTKDALLSEGLLEPLSDKLIVPGAVKKQVAGLEAGRRVHVNDALDALSAHLDHDRPLPASHSMKPLTGDYAPSTHELYLWSDGTASRLLGHYDDGRFIADKIIPHPK